MDQACNQIEQGLYLGNWVAATNEEFLQKCNVTHIVTVHMDSLPADIACNRKNLKIPEHDIPESDLLHYFDETYKFISSCPSGESVLVHCQHGISRSATVVIAFLMKRDSMSYKDTHRRVMTKRRVIFPNSGFVNQLLLYESMERELAFTYEYKLFCLYQASVYSKAFALNKKRYVKLFGNSWRNVPSPLSNWEIKCRKCRTTLAPQGYLVPHRTGVSPNWRYVDDLQDEDVCRKSFFSMPLVEMFKTLQVSRGKIYCSKCSQKVGNFDWSMDSCPCGATLDASFCFVPSKVDCLRVNLAVTSLRGTS